MKKVLSAFGLIIVISILLAGTYLANQRGVVAGEVLHTDTRVFIDGIEIAGYYIDGHIYVLASDLPAYGFIVGWNNHAQSIVINRGVASRQPAIIPTDGYEAGSVAFYFYYSDVTAYVNNQRVSSYNLGGQIAVRASQLAYANLSITQNNETNIIQLTLNEPMPENSGYYGLEHEIFMLINAYRASNGLQPLSSHAGLDSVAYAHAQDFYGLAVVSNIGTDGANMVERVARYGLDMVHVSGFTAKRAGDSAQELFEWLLTSTARQTAMLNNFADFVGLNIISYTQEDGTTSQIMVLKMATDAVNDPDQFATYVFEIINDTRVSSGLNALIFDQELADVSLLRAENGLTNGATGMLSLGMVGEIDQNLVHPRSFVAMLADISPESNILHPDVVSVGASALFSEATSADHRVHLRASALFKTYDGQVTDVANPMHLSNMELMNKMPMSQIVLPTYRVTTEEERAAWIAEYHELGGASQWEKEIARLVSEYRVSRGLSPVTWEPTLAMAARYYTQLIIHIGYITGGDMPGTAHTQGPHNTSVNTARSFGGVIEFGGNAFTPGRNTPEAIVQGWIDSPGHHRYLISPSHRYIGVGASIDDDRTQHRSFNYLFMSANPS